MGKKVSLLRRTLIRKALLRLHVHLGAPPGFGKTMLLHQMYNHFMRGGRTARKGCFIDTSQESLQNVESLIPPSDDGGVWIVAMDNLTAKEFPLLLRLLAWIGNREKPGMRLFTAGLPLPRSFILHRVAEISLELGMEDLDFTLEEVRALSPLHGSRIYDLTKGWPFPTAYLAALPSFAHAPALEDRNSVLRTWMRQQVLGPWTEEERDLLMRGATLEVLDAASVKHLGLSRTIMECLDGMAWNGCPLLRDEARFRMHPFMRLCLRADLSDQDDAKKEWDATIRFYRTRGALLQAARAAWEAGCPEKLAAILAQLENSVHRIFDPNLKKELGTWLDFVFEKSVEIPSRVFSLMARYKSMTGEHRAARKWAKRAALLARHDGDASAAIRSSLLAARLLRSRSSLEESDRLLRGLQAEFPMMTWVLRYEVLAELAYNRILECDYQQALSLMNDLKEAAFAAGHYTSLWAERFMTIPLFYLGRYAEALACFNAARSLPEEQQMVLDRHGVHVIAAKCLQIRGYFAECRALVERRFAMKTFSDDPDDRWMSLFLAAEIELGEQEADLQRGAGDLSRMADLLSQAQAMLPENLENVAFQSWFKAYKRILDAYTHLETMPQTLREAVREAREGSLFLYGLLLLRSSAWRFSILGDRENLPEIVDMLHECVGVCERIGCEVLGSLAHATLSRVYSFLHLRESAKNHLQIAFDYLEREDAFGLFRIVPEMEPFIRVAREEGLAPKFTARAVESFGYRPPKVRVKLFGRFKIASLPGKTPVPINRSKIREMFAYLVCREGRAATRREMASALWPGVSFDKAVRLCSVTLSQLRAVLKTVGLEQALVGNHGVYRLDTSEMVLDTDGLDHLEAAAALLPLIEREGQKLSEEFETLYLASLREGYLGEFKTPWAREAARTIDARVAEIDRVNQK